MIKLLAKSQVDGRYYFTEDEESVYMIKSPLAEAQKEFVDALPVFLEKSFDSGLVYDDQEFQNFEELRAFAISDSAPEKRGVDLTSQESIGPPYIKNVGQLGCLKLLEDIYRYDQHIRSFNPEIDELWEELKRNGASNLERAHQILCRLQMRYEGASYMLATLNNYAEVIIRGI